MVVESKSVGALALRLIAGLVLLGCPGIGGAAGIWSVLSLPLNLGGVVHPRAVAASAAGDLFVADGIRIQKRDAQGNWSLIAAYGASALAVDAAGNLYVADSVNNRIQERDAQGNWSLIATKGSALGQVNSSYGATLAVDAAGNLYLADHGGGWGSGWRVQKRDVHGNWSGIAGEGNALGQVGPPSASPPLAVDTAGNLYVADQPLTGNAVSARIQKRDVKGNWSLIATYGGTLGRVGIPSALTVDAAGNLYVADLANSRIQKRDAQGNWLLIAAGGGVLGQVDSPTGLAADIAGNVYVTDESALGRLQKRDAQGNWSVFASGPSSGWVSNPTALAADAVGGLYVADNDRIQKRDQHGNWAVIATEGGNLAVDTAGDLYVAGDGIQKWDVQGRWSVVDANHSGLLAADAAGNLYVAEVVDLNTGSYRIQKRDALGNWSVIAPSGFDSGRVWFPTALAVDPVGKLYVADRFFDGLGFTDRIQKRDADGNWSVIATEGGGVDHVSNARALAVDSAGNLYVAESVDQVGENRIQKRDAGGDWAVIATSGTATGQVDNPTGLAVDGAGHLYVADTANNRVQEYSPAPGP